MKIGKMPPRSEKIDVLKLRDNGTLRKRLSNEKQWQGNKARTGARDTPKAM